MVVAQVHLPNPLQLLKPTLLRSPRLKIVTAGIVLMRHLMTIMHIMTINALKVQRLNMLATRKHCNWIQVTLPVKQALHTTTTNRPEGRMGLVDVFQEDKAIYPLQNLLVFGDILFVGL
jgi:hypothetical protein